MKNQQDLKEKVKSEARCRYSYYVSGFINENLQNERLCQMKRVAFIEGAEWMMGEVGWKEVAKGEFPDVGQMVVGYRPLAHTHGDSVVTILKYTGSKQIDLNGVEHCFERNHHVTHWMPLPTPPQPKTR